MKKVVLATLVAFAVTAQSGIYVGALGGWSFSDAPSPNDQQFQATSKSIDILPSLKEGDSYGILQGGSAHAAPRVSAADR